MNGTTDIPSGLFTRHDTFGGVELFCGDCVPIMRALPAESVDMVLSDPPYGIDFLSKRTDNHDKIADDAFDDWSAALPVWLAEWHRLLTPTGVAACCCGGGGGKAPVSALFTMELLKAGFNLIQTLIWDKKTLGLGWRYRPSYETILVFSKAKDDYNWFTERQDVSNILRFGNVIPGPNDHPTPKPVNLMRELLRLHTEPGMLVLEPFMGGGTTPLACEMEGRRCIATELVEKYYNIAKRRVWEEHVQGSLFDLNTKE